MQKLKCAVIGVGNFGKFHAEKYTKLPHAELIAVCDINAEQSQKVAKLYTAKSCLDYHELLGKVDAVSIATPAFSHYQIAKDFLQYNTHILLEKPMATTSEEAAELIALAKQHKVVLQIGHLERFNPVVLALNNVLRKPLFIESIRLAQFKPHIKDINVILDLMIHDIDLIQALVNVPITNISANGAPVLSKEIDIANARIEFNNGCTANVTASRINFETKRKLHIFTAESFYVGDLHSKSLDIYHKDTNKIFSGIAEIDCNHSVLANTDALFEEIKAFLFAIINNTPPLASGEDGMYALQTAIRISKIVQNKLQEYYEK